MVQNNHLIQKYQLLSPNIWLDKEQHTSDVFR